MVPSGTSLRLDLLFFCNQSGVELFSFRKVHWGQNDS